MFDSWHPRFLGNFWTQLQTSNASQLRPKENRAYSSGLRPPSNTLCSSGGIRTLVGPPISQYDFEFYFVRFMKCTIAMPCNILYDLIISQKMYLHCQTYDLQSARYTSGATGYITSGYLQMYSWLKMFISFSEVRFKWNVEKKKLFLKNC